MSFDKIIIRKANSDDLNAICIIENACFTLPWTRGDIQSDLLNNTFATYFVAVFDEVKKNHDEESEAALYKDSQNKKVIAGFISLHLVFENAQIVNLAVMPQYRGKGIGLLLINEAVKYCILCKCDAITLEVRVSNSYAIKLYEAAGFTTVGVRKSYYSDNGEDAYLMLLALV